MGVLNIYTPNSGDMARSRTPGKLTALDVKNAQPKGKPYKMGDGGGLLLLIHTNGSRYWRLKYRYATKEKMLALGVYPEVSLAKARKEAMSAREQLADGVDPMADRKAKKLDERVNNSFCAVAKEWHQKNTGRWSVKHSQRVWASIEADVLPKIGDTPINALTSQDCLVVLRHVEERGALDVASRIKQRLSAVFRYAVYTGKATQNPVDVLKDVIETRKVTHMAALPASKLPEFLHKLETTDQLYITTKLGLQLIVLTFVRAGELRGALWSEFDLAKREWRIPAERMKMKEEHIIPLSDQAIAVIEVLRPITGGLELLFPGIRNPRKPMSENTLTFAIRKRLGFDATAHGFRATASTILNETGFRSDVIERQLAHGERNKVRAAYNRSQYLQERREMMQWWADYLDALKAGAKVIPIKHKAI